MREIRLNYRFTGTLNADNTVSKIHDTMFNKDYDIHELNRLHNVYERVCTAEYIFENYKFDSFEDAYDRADEIREYQNDYECSEIDAIYDYVFGNDIEQRE